MKWKEYLVDKNINTFTIYNEKYEEQDLPDLSLMIKRDIPILGEIGTDRFFVQYGENKSPESYPYHQVHIFQRLKAEQIYHKDCHGLNSTYKCQSCGLTIQLTYTIPDTKILKR